MKTVGLAILTFSNKFVITCPIACDVEVLGLNPN